MNVSEMELAHRRTMMGTAAQGWVSSPTMFGSVGPRSWSVLTGSLAPDMNMALIHSADPELLVEPLTQIARRTCHAILMLAGIFYGSQYGGAIGAILLNLPSHPPHAVTCLDGYPMTKQGKGGTALGITLLRDRAGD